MNPVANIASKLIPGKFNENIKQLHVKYQTEIALTLPLNLTPSSALFKVDQLIQLFQFQVKMTEQNHMALFVHIDPLIPTSWNFPFESLHTEKILQIYSLLNVFKIIMTT